LGESAPAQQIPAAPEVVETGNRGEGDRGPQAQWHQPAIRIRKRHPEPGERAGIRQRRKSHPHQPGDAKGELEGGFPFPKIVGGEDLAGFDRDLPQAGDEKFPADDQRSRPHWAKTGGGKIHERGTDEDFVGQRIEQFPERCHQAQFPRQIAVEPIAGGGNGEGNQRDHMTNQPARGGRGDENDSEDQSRKGDRIRQIHSRNVGNACRERNKGLR
jgi:hypothetical protein